MKRARIGFVGALVALALVTAGCAPAAESSIDLDDDTVVIDVRTPAEYASGHLEGAVNIDFSAAEFATEVADLDPDTDYVVYCQTGNRSARAVEVMRAGGLDVRDAGGVTAAAEATGLPIVVGDGSGAS